MYILTAAVLIMVHLSVCVTMLIWAAGIVGTTIYVVYQYVWTARAKATPRMHAAADFGFMIVTLAYVAVIAANKYGPELIEYITAHWDDCLYYIDIVMQSMKTIPSIAVLLQIHELYPHIAALIAHTPEYATYYEQISILPPDELVSAVGNLGTQLMELGQQLASPVIGEYTEALASRMYMHVVQVVVENHSDWPTYFSTSTQEWIRTSVSTETVADMDELIRQLYHEETSCLLFERLHATELEAINAKFKMICEMVIQKGT